MNISGEPNINDELTGGRTNDSLYGDGGDDTLEGGKGNDTLTGGAGADVFVYNLGDGNDTITDYEPADKISVAGGVASVSTDGNDIILTIGSGKILLKNVNDGTVITYIDEDGEHTYPEETVEFSSDGKTATLLENYSGGSFDIADYTEYNGKDYSDSVQTIDASAVKQDIAITGNDKANSIAGSAGNDTLNGGKGNDKLYGGEGSDVFVYNPGDGNDFIEDYENEDTIHVNGTVSKITQTKAGTVILYVSSNKISVKGGDERVITYVDDTGSHTYPKVVEVDGTSVSLLSAYIDDTFDVNTSPYVANDDPDKIKTIDASVVEHDIAITGNKQANNIIGGAGNNTLDGGKGNDSLTGGDGADTFLYTTGDGNDTITDYDENDKIVIDGEVTDVTATSKGNVVIKVGSGRVVVAGGADKKIRYVDSVENLSVNSEGTGVTLLSNYRDDTFDVNTNEQVADYATKLKTIDASNIEYSLEITGNKQANKIIGGQDDDLIDGGASKDNIKGGDGNDTIIGGKANDTLTGGEGDNVFVFQTGEGNNVITDFKNSDTILVTSGTASAVDWTASDSGDVVMTVGTTKVTLQGAAGKYIHVVDSNGDDMWYPNPPPIPVIFDAKTKTAILTEGYFSDIFVRSDYFEISADIKNIDASAVTHDISIVADTNKNSIVGSTQNDFINGVAGNDTIDGGEGDDTIQGGKGTDKLTGGEGADTFVYNKGDGNDFIEDYNGDDIIQINDAAVTKVTETNAGTVILWVGSNKISVKGGTSNVITYTDAAGSHTYPEPEGIVEINDKGTGATLSADYIAPSFDVNTNPLVADYTTELKTIDGSAVESDIAITGNSLANNIKGGAGNDILKGNAGNDTLKGGEGADVFVYNDGDGNDRIQKYDEEDLIKINGAVSKIATTKAGTVIFTIGSGKISVESGTEHVITYTDTTGMHTYPKVVDVDGTSVSLTADYVDDTFDVNINPYVANDSPEKIKTINASTVEHDIAIVGNKQANKITGGAGNDTFTGGKGNDTFTGGDGADVFVYNNGDGNDVIQNYTAEDRLFFADTKIDALNDISVSGDDVIFTVGKGKVTVKDAAEKIIAYSDVDGEEVVDHSYPQIIEISKDGKSATLFAAYSKDTFDVAADATNYKDTLLKIDATAVTHDLTIIANAKANTIYATTSDDSIDGGAGKDIIYGLEGNDTIIGNTGDDTLRGGSGKDTFIYNAGDGDDVIADYTASDEIRINGAAGSPSVYNDNSNVIIEVGSNTITIENAATDSTLVTYYVGTTRKQYNPDLPADAQDLLIDDNYSATAALSAIVEPVKAQYTPYDFEASFDLVKQPGFAPAIAYSDKK